MGALKAVTTCDRPANESAGIIDQKLNTAGRGGIPDCTEFAYYLATFRSADGKMFTTSITKYGQIISGETKAPTK